MLDPHVVADELEKLSKQDQEPVRRWAVIDPRKGRPPGSWLTPDGNLVIPNRATRGAKPRLNRKPKRGSSAPGAHATVKPTAAFTVRPRADLSSVPKNGEDYLD